MSVTIIILSTIILILLGILIYLSLKYKTLKTDYEADKDMFLYYKNKISMIEYHYRNFKEGQNAFTVLRRISDTLKDFYN